MHRRNVDSLLFVHSNYLKCSCSPCKKNVDHKSFILWFRMPYRRYQRAVHPCSSRVLSHLSLSSARLNFLQSVNINRSGAIKKLKKWNILSHFQLHSQKFKIFQLWVVKLDPLQIIIMQDIKNWLLRLPFLTRHWFIAATVLPLLVRFGVVRGDHGSKGRDKSASVLCCQSNMSDLACIRGWIQ